MFDIVFPPFAQGTFYRIFPALPPVPIKPAGASVYLAGVENFPGRSGGIDIAAFLTLQHQLLGADRKGVGKK